MLTFHSKQFLFIKFFDLGPPWWSNRNIGFKNVILPLKNACWRKVFEVKSCFFGVYYLDLGLSQIKKKFGFPLPGSFGFYCIKCPLLAEFCSNLKIKAIFGISGKFYPRKVVSRGL